MNKSQGFSLKTTKKPLYQLIATGLLTLASLNVMAETGNPRVNQLGYLPNGVKTATYKTTSDSAQTWQLKQNGTVVATGQTTPSSTDSSSGDKLQQIDLSSVTATGTGFTLTVGSDTSYTFAISATALKGVLYDSMKYFYHNRSGIAIDTQYTGGGNGSFASNSKWSRPAGHLNLGANKGDVNVPCWSGTCNYTLNVSKGWYDAGDHGKYVVNGGISAWTLLNLYERGLYLTTNSSLVGDGKLNIPESANGIPDVLDEARWEVEFLISMQVPVGQAKAGMVHHKMHDVGWTGFPLAPHEDPQQRALVPPSTAATLNLAAVAAQAARIWKDIDSGFAATCLTAAKRAWDAAQANPNDLYSGNYDNGGGGYGDKTVSDDFYWAAAELYITTGDSKYLSTLNSFTILRTDFGWADTDLAGLVSLATVPSTQTASLRSAAQQKIVTIADSHIATQNASGYPAPMSNLEYYWGSNGGVANKLLLMGLAYDFTKNDTYAKGVGKGLGYIFGQNALSTSFVTGEGTKTATQPHHRFWSNAINGNYPVAPPGALSGGPNAGLDDTTSAAQLAACKSKPATCWIDNINAYAVNEITINWNAPLAWDLAFYNDYAQGNNGGTSSSSTVSSSSVATSSSSKPSSSSTPSSSSVPSSSSKPSSSSVASTSSSSVKSSAPSSSSSSSVASGQQCNWYGSLTPLCATTTSGWGYENGKSCVAPSTCSAQPAPYGIVGGSSSSSSAANHAPTVGIAYSYATTCPQGVVTLTANGSDVDGDALTYDWLVTYDSSSYTYSGKTLAGFGMRPVKNYTFTVTVKDGKGGVGTATQVLNHSYTDYCVNSSSSSSSSIPRSSSSVATSSSSVATSSSSIKSSSSSSIASGAKCTYVVANEWNTGFTGAVRITNNGTSAINGWNVSWAYTDGTKLTNSWNATVTGSNPYSAANLNWNNLIQPGQSVEIGIQGNKGGSSAQIPTVTGSVCQ
jgi:endoglucanase